ncbi:MAG: sigma-70 family RNA polymerase sigma factor [Phycisphaerales bacterium]|nr:sigma-70 family RNA polymerase sigma factor [Phycisphaerales bacterium]
MPTFATKDLAELAHQLLLSPRQKRLSQIHGINTLLGLVDAEKSYPYDMVCFHITGYRNRRNSERPAIPGDKLVGDLVTLAEHITRKNAIPVAEVGEPVRGYEELASDLKVSTKTIRRWRKRGLMGFRVADTDGVSRLVYLGSTVDRFVESNKSLVERGAAFKQLSASEKTKIIELARKLLSERRRKLHIVAREISEQTGRAVETIRYTLRRYDQAHPDKALFGRNGLPAAPEQQRKIWRAHEQGNDNAKIARLFGITVEEVQRNLLEMQARKLKAEPVAYIHNELFDAPGADALILDVPVPTGSRPSKAKPPRDLPAYLRSLYEIPLLTAEQEVDAFRRYNYLKHKTARAIEALDICDVKPRDLDAIAELTARYEAQRRRIVEANLRLVVSIAKKHVGWSPRFFEVISDGNVSLMRAVEKFDVSRGFKFSTYASWAIMKNYARTVPEEHYHASRFVTGQDELIDAKAGEHTAVGEDLDRATLTRAIEESMRDLTDRERTIVADHFGLFGAEETSTLEELGQRFGVTKERVRQIERRAIEKIKGALSPAVAGLLPD